MVKGSITVPFNVRKCEDCFFGVWVYAGWRKEWQHFNEQSPVCRNTGKKVRLLLVLLMVLILSTSWALPAEAKFRPVKFLKRAACLAVGVVAFPVAAPLNYVVQSTAAEFYMHHGNWRAATIMIEGKVYDWFWLENCF